MSSQFVELSETDSPLEETMSVNHARLTTRLVALLLPFESQYEVDVLTELECELSTGRAKPDVAIVPGQHYDWERDVMRYPHPPLTAIEVLSPTQSFSSLVSKIREVYFPAGVRSAWLVVPEVRTVHLYLPQQPAVAYHTGLLRDPTTGVEVALEALFG